ncbi:hypothetical protein [Streptomyces sp. NBC_00687]|uniref:hypothetical protein n=1 Tax=Streptomyces sp. NBC_00687 TaxID=2975807 RepID=UPI00225B3C73|nr:hypothetical protein [Streptomyces sp. NBC_00687]MCX4915933.1 hypothetical protein [Streptomyces sp. NBC_00687]
MSESLTQPTPPAPSLADFALTGDLARPARLTVPDLLAWPQHRVRVSFDCATSGHFTGRDLSSLYDRLDLRAALLCRPRRPARP